MTCPDCEALQRRLGIQAQEYNDLALQIASLQAETLTLVYQKRALQRMLDEREIRTAPAQDVMAILKLWRATCVVPRSRNRVSIDLNGDRAKTARAALKSKVTGDRKTRRRTCMDAIRGLGMRPYVVDSKRSAEGSKEQRYADVEHALSSEKRIEQHADYYRSTRTVVEDPRAGEVAAYVAALTDDVADRLKSIRGWALKSIRALELGLDGDRVVFPARNAEGLTVGLSRYAPNASARRGLKMLAEGSRELFPRPEIYRGGTAWLVEGEPDCVSARSSGLQAVGVPGVGTWKDGWSKRFSHFDLVAVTFDCDEVGREAAHARAGSLATFVAAKVVDIDPGRDDGYDVTDVLLANGSVLASALLRQRLAATSHAVAPLRTKRPIPKRRPYGDPIDVFVRALEDADCNPRRSGAGLEARCPAHDDRHASLSVAEGGDGRVLVHCHTGCLPDDVLKALRLEWTDVFPEREGA